MSELRAYPHEPSVCEISGQFARDFRKHVRMNLKVASEKIGVSLVELSSFEVGKNFLPIQNMARLAAMMDPQDSNEFWEKVKQDAISYSNICRQVRF